MCHSWEETFQTEWRLLLLTLFLFHWLQPASTMHVTWPKRNHLGDFSTLASEGYLTKKYIYHILSY